MSTIAHGLIIVHSCGHSEVTADADPEKLDWIASKPCKNCWLKKRAAKAEAAARKAERQGLPPLEGSPRQISWAESERRRLLDGLERAAREFAGTPLGARAERVRERVVRETSASFWIEHRDTAPKALARILYREALTDQAALL